VQHQSNCHLCQNNTFVTMYIRLHFVHQDFVLKPIESGRVVEERMRDMGGEVGRSVASSMAALFSTIRST
jgi:hypothetical protein